MTLVCFLEEPSAAEMLKAVLPRICPRKVGVQYIVFEGKQDLENNILRRLRLWQASDSCFLVMRDQDSADCKVVKSSLMAKIAASGKSARTLIRIACHELETFYLGDLAAVEAGLQLHKLARHQNKANYREPDTKPNPAQMLKKLTASRYQKISGSRAIAPHLKLDGSNRSTSFNALVNGIQRLVTHIPTTRGFT